MLFSPALQSDDGGRIVAQMEQRPLHPSPLRPLGHPPSLFPPKPSPSLVPPQTNHWRPAASPPPSFLSPATTPLCTVRLPPLLSLFPDNPPPISDDGPNRWFKSRPSASPPACAASELELLRSIHGGERVEMMAMILARPAWDFETPTQTE